MREKPDPGRGSGLERAATRLTSPDAFASAPGLKALLRLGHGLGLVFDDLRDVAKVFGRAGHEADAIGEGITFLFINMSFELAGNSTCLALARAWLPARQPARRAVKGVPLDGEPRLLPGKKGEGSGSRSYDAFLISVSRTTRSCCS